MEFNAIDLTNFKKFDRDSFTFSKSFNVIIGRNGAGKSSILEAIELIGQNKHKTYYEKQINISTDKKYFTISAEISINSAIATARIKFVDGKLTRTVNDIPKNLQDIDYIKSIFFDGRQLELVMIAPSHRREFLDDIVEVLYPSYRDIRIKFIDIQKKRNLVLKRSQKKLFSTGVIDEPADLKSWDSKFIELSIIISEYRLKVIDTINSNLQKAEIIYKSGIDPIVPIIINNTQESMDFMRQKLTSNRRHDIVKGFTTIGPQADDWSIKWDSLDIIKSASRGEKRVSFIRVIISIFNIINEISNNKAVLLIDDPLSELDENNRKNILEQISALKGQIIMTVLPNQKNLFKDIDVSFIEI